MMWRPMAFMGSPPPQDYGGDSATDPFDLVLDRANDDFFEVQPASGKPLVDHPAYSRFNLGLRRAVRLVNHPVGPTGDTDPHRGSDRLAWFRGDVGGVHRRDQSAGGYLGGYFQECGVLGQHAADADQVEVADLGGQQRVI